MEENFKHRSGLPGRPSKDWLLSENAIWEWGGSGVGVCKGGVIEALHSRSDIGQ